MGILMLVIAWGIHVFLWCLFTTPLTASLLTLGLWLGILAGTPWLCAWGWRRDEAAARWWQQQMRRPLIGRVRNRWQGQARRHDG